MAPPTLRPGNLVCHATFAFDSPPNFVGSLESSDTLPAFGPRNWGQSACKDGVKTAVAVLRGEKVEAVIDTGVGFVTKANMDTPEMAELLHPPFDKYLK